MAITLSGNRITIKYEEGDTKGNSWANPYTMADIYETAIENEWPGITRIGSMYNTKYDFLITGVSTYFWAYEENGLTIFFDFPSARQAIETAANCYFRSGFNREGVGETGTLYYMPTVWGTKNANSSNTVMKLISANIEMWNTVFSYMRPNINGLSGNPAILDNASIYKSATFEIGVHVKATNLYVYYTALTVNSSPVELKNVNLFNLSQFYSNQLINLIGKNINFYNGAYAQLLLINGINKSSTLIDSNMPKYSNTYARWQSHASYRTSEYTLYLKSTFNFIIGNSVDATLTLYDKNDTVVIDTVLDGSIYSSEVTYVKEMGYHDGDVETANVTVTTTEYEPFRLVISKLGYEDLRINDISIIPGEPTFIRGEFELHPILIYISSILKTHCTDSESNDGSITIEAEGGTSPYEYSIDGGKTWCEDNTFENLSSGVYEVKVRDVIENETDAFNVKIIKPNTKFFVLSKI